MRALLLRGACAPPRHEPSPLNSRGAPRRRRSHLEPSPLNSRGAPCRRRSHLVTQLSWCSPSVEISSRHSTLVALPVGGDLISSLSRRRRRWRQPCGRHPCHWHRGLHRKRPQGRRGPVVYPRCEAHAPLHRAASTPPVLRRYLLVQRLVGWPCGSCLQGGGAGRRRGAPLLLSLRALTGNAMPLTDRVERPPRHADELRARRVAWVSAERMSTSVCACQGSEWEHVKTIARDANLLAPERALG